MKNLTACFPEDSFGSAFYMPSRQLLQYLLHQLIAVVALLEKIVYFSEKAGYFFLERIKAGHSWSMALIFLAVCSRVRLDFTERISWQKLTIFMTQLYIKKTGLETMYAIQRAGRVSTKIKTLWTRLAKGKI
jgi:Domain of unknown function (DUF4477)